MVLLVQEEDVQEEVVVVEEAEVAVVAEGEVDQAHPDILQEAAVSAEEVEVDQARPDILEVAQDTLEEAIDTILVHVPIPSAVRQNTKAVAHPKGSQN